jgi:hypothetical protein
MAHKKHEQSSFTVTDRRLFTSDGALRSEVVEEVESAPQPPPAPPAPAVEESARLVESPGQKPEATADTVGERDIPLPPSIAEQDAQAAAYKQSSRDVDSQVELSGHSAKEFEMTFERFLASLYMTAMLQLGMMREQGQQPRVDLIGSWKKTSYRTAFTSSAWPMWRSRTRWLVRQNRGRRREPG